MGARNILIVGGGLVGYTLADRLSRDGRDVTIVEADAERVRDLSETLDVRVVEGNGSTMAVLRAAGIDRADLVVAATESDATNVVVGFLATERFHVENVVVRVRDSGHEETFLRAGEEPGARHVCVNPDTASVDRIAALLEVPGAVDVMRFMDGGLLVAGFRILHSSDFAGLRVSDMKLLFASTPTLVVAIERDGRWIVPGGTEEILPGDLVYFAIARQELQDVLSLVGVEPEKRGRVMVAGATSIGLALAQRLEARDVRVVLVEPDAAAAQHAAHELNHALVIRGLPTDQGLLEDEEIETVSTFVAVSADHEANLVSGLLARRLGAGRSIVLIDNPAMVTMVGDIGIDAIISERLLAISLTLQHIRGGGVRSGAALLGEEVEIVEVEGERGSRLTSGRLADVALPRGMLVAALQRGEEMVVPTGHDAVQPGDRVLIVAMREQAGRLAHFLTPQASAAEK